MYFTRHCKIKIALNWGIKPIVSLSPKKSTCYRQQSLVTLVGCRGALNQNQRRYRLSQLLIYSCEGLLRVVTSLPKYDHKRRLWAHTAPEIAKVKINGRSQHRSLNFTVKLASFGTLRSFTPGRLCKDLVV